MRVLQTCSESNLLNETLGADACCELGVEHFDRNAPVVLRIACEVHCRHAPASERPVQLIHSAVLTVHAVGHRLGFGSLEDRL